ncbi:hypothetical protein TSAR_010514 [Trichomalopsis sarcophagae]|uniref:Uncharacterized protein n=1 Tax=Trichomalopsis sarcophagae TaxID=543379 RepID=A0A232F6A5_9HYME|nr:hypothetical protein TSAR_010514 [Trichomalopsis sarcophagae]
MDVDDANLKDGDSAYAEQCATTHPTQTFTIAIPASQPTIGIQKKKFEKGKCPQKHPLPRRIQSTYVSKHNSFVIHFKAHSSTLVSSSHPHLPKSFNDPTPRHKSQQFSDRSSVIAEEPLREGDGNGDLLKSSSGMLLLPGCPDSPEGRVVEDNKLQPSFNSKDL